MRYGRRASSAATHKIRRIVTLLVGFEGACPIYRSCCSTTDAASAIGSYVSYDPSPFHVRRDRFGGREGAFGDTVGDAMAGTTGEDAGPRSDAVDAKLADLPPLGCSGTPHRWRDALYLACAGRSSTGKGLDLGALPIRGGKRCPSQWRRTVGRETLYRRDPRGPQHDPSRGRLSPSCLACSAVRPTPPPRRRAAGHRALVRRGIPSRRRFVAAVIQVTIGGETRPAMPSEIRVTSSDTSVVLVAANDALIAVGDGQSDITITWSASPDISATRTVTITSEILNGVTLLAPVSMEPGDSAA